MIRSYIDNYKKQICYFFSVLFYNEKKKSKNKKLTKSSEEYTISVLFPTEDIMRDALKRNK